MSIISDLKKGVLNRKLIFVILLVVIEFPILVPLKTPIAITEPTKKIYDFIENIPEGSTVLFCCEWGIMSWPPHGPMTTAILEHLFARPIKIVIFSIAVEGPVMIEKIFGIIDRHGKQYGVDYVHIGYIPGVESALAAFAKDPSVSQVDYYGTQLNTLPLMNQVKSKDDFYVFAWDTAGAYDMYFRQFPDIPQIACVEAGGVPQIIPYYQTGALTGYLNGILGASEYEGLLNISGFGTAQMDAISTSHLYGIALLVLTNLEVIIKKFGGSK
jgi:hypothetical protein